MPYKVAAFYQFAALPDFRELREPLRALCAELDLKGSVLLAREGINGTLAGSDDGIAVVYQAGGGGERRGRPRLRNTASHHCPGPDECANNPRQIEADLGRGKSKRTATK